MQKTAWRWWGVALRGIAAVALGVLSLFLPGLTFLSLVIVFGVYAIVDGGLALAVASRETQGPRWSTVARGMASMVAGVLALVWPGITALALLIVIGSWAVASGVLEIWTAIRLRRQLRGEWLLVLEGILSIAFGLALFIAPAAGALALGLWVGVYALVLGGLLIAAAVRIRSRTRQGQPSLAAA
jgi:uncharacterized membrane protein HdeD (DUF308 family)